MSALEMYGEVLEVARLWSRWVNEKLVMVEMEVRAQCPRVGGELKGVYAVI